MSKDGSLVSPSLAPFSAKTKEIWKDIPDTNGIYQVSNYGRVRSFTNRGSHSPGDLLKPRLDIKGYSYVCVIINGRYTPKKIHRLVALAFVPNDLNLPEVNHKDEDKTNARADNLEWCNHLYNVRYGTGRERLESQLRKRICQYSFDGKLIKIWPSANGASRSLFINSACVIRAANGETKTYHQYIWLYENDEKREEKLHNILSWLKIDRNNSYGKFTPVGAYNAFGELVKSYKSMRGAEVDGFSSSSIHRSIKKGVKHYGYYWRYLTP